MVYSILSGKLATHDIGSVPMENASDDKLDLKRQDIIREDEILNMPPPLTSGISDNKNYVWRIDLAKTEQHWSGWFKGLSASFLNIQAPKMLLLAGVDRLDRELIVGQMQGNAPKKFLLKDRHWKMEFSGKFQMQVLPACGHAVHEDVPDKVAEAIATFMVRHKFAEPASDFPRYANH